MPVRFVSMKGPHRASPRQAIQHVLVLRHVSRIIKVDELVRPDLRVDDRYKNRECDRDGDVPKVVSDCTCRARCLLGLLDRRLFPVSFSRQEGKGSAVSHRATLQKD